MTRLAKRRSFEEGYVPRLGVSMLELLVAISVIGLLVALLLPAVQNSRESARRIQCLSQIRQLGLATSNFSEARSVLPRGDIALIEILPFVEGAPRVSDGQFVTHVPVYVCPSDNTVPGDQPQIAKTDYRMNDGACLGLAQSMAPFSRNGVYMFNTQFRGFKGYQPKDFTDGFSTTALFSERFYGLGFDRTEEKCKANPQLCLWYVKARFYTGEEDAFFAHCREPDNRTGTKPILRAEQQSIYSWEEPYDHVFPPNTIGCYARPTDDADHTNDAAIPATSRHPEGVNVCFCDGSARLSPTGSISSCGERSVLEMATS